MDTLHVFYSFRLLLLSQISTTQDDVVTRRHHDRQLKFQTVGPHCSKGWMSIITPLVSLSNYFKGLGEC